jgi:hypothetical protein
LVAGSIKASIGRIMRPKMTVMKYGTSGA